jgi:branched-chain amino acid transport system ATP-binding protein
VSSTPTTTRILEVEGLSARYGHVEALRPVDLHVDEGELVAVL